MSIVDDIRDIAAALWSAGRRRVSGWWWATPLHQRRLEGAAPADRLLFQPEDRRAGALERGDAIRRGRFTLLGHRRDAAGALIWAAAEEEDPAWRAELHAFDWLVDLDADGGEACRNAARRLTNAWLERFGEWDAEMWEPEIIARRLQSWFYHGQLLMTGADVVLRTALMRSAEMQARHLARAIGVIAPGPARLRAAVALIYSGLCLPNARQRVERGAALLTTEIGAQILPDGCHVSRNPARVLEFMSCFAALHRDMASCGVTPPDALRHAIDRMAAALRMFQHGDARLALFNGAAEEVEGLVVDDVLAFAEVKGRPLNWAPAAGYHRVETRRALLIVDAGAPPRGPASIEAHAGCLSFEFSCSRHRLITNCGAARQRGAAWSRATRGVAAHSTLGLDDAQPGRVLGDNLIGRLLGPRLVNGASLVDGKRQDDDSGVWLDLAHDGFVPSRSIVHRRRLFLDAEGVDLRGEDSLYPTVDARRVRDGGFSIRFHLHPDVRASLSKSGTTAILAPQDGDGWTLRASGAHIALEDSIYLGHGGEPRPSRQVVLSGETVNGEAVVKWALRRAADPKK